MTTFALQPGMWHQVGVCVF